MLIYHSHNANAGLKKAYKSVSKRRNSPHSSRSVVGKGSKKKISTKNARFLQGLGLKVKKK